MELLICFSVPNICLKFENNCLCFHFICMFWCEIMKMKVNISFFYNYCLKMQINFLQLKHILTISSKYKNAYQMSRQVNSKVTAKAILVRGFTLTASHLVSFLNFAQLACTAKFNIEPKCAAVKVTPLTEVIKPFKLLWRTHWLQWIMIGWSYRKLVLQEDWFWLPILSTFNLMFPAF